MMRRFWPAAFAAVSILVFGSYLGYTQYLVRRIQKEAAIHAQIYAIVQAAMLSLTEEGVAGNALMDVQNQLHQLNVPVVFLDETGDPWFAARLPGDPDVTTEAGKLAARRFATELSVRKPGHVISQQGIGQVYFGDPPALAWLRWVPYMQVGAGILLMMVAFVIVRADIRAHRERLWSAMARELAHQMGTPLSSLHGWVEVLQLPAAERKSMASEEKIASVMHADVERLERVSRRFELIGKPHAQETVSIADVVNELVGYYRPRLPHLGRGVVLRTRSTPNLPLVRANGVLLVWALENIVKNAIDALAGRGGRISVIALRQAAKARHAPGGVRILIVDNGPGIAPNIRERIFEPGVSSKSGGWGVGLSLSRRIIEELHHGRITVQNRPGGGTIFDVVLPAART